MSKKCISFLLVLALVSSFMPLSAFAEEPAPTEIVETQPEEEPSAEPGQQEVSEEHPAPSGQEVSEAPSAPGGQQEAPETPAVPAEEPPVPEAEVSGPEPEAEAPTEVTEPAQENGALTPAVPEEQTGGNTDPMPIKVTFRLTNDSAELIVFSKDDQGQKTEIKPEKDGSFMLVPGRYYYTLKAEGYEPIEEKSFDVRNSEQPVEIVPVLVPVEPAEETEKPSEEEGTDDGQPVPSEEQEGASVTDGDTVPEPDEPSATEEESEVPEENAEAAEEDGASVNDEGNTDDEENEPGNEDAEESEKFEEGVTAANTKAFAGSTNLVLNEYLDVEVGEGETVTLSFIPEESGLYSFSSNASNDTRGTLYAVNGNIIAESDDGPVDFNFEIIYELTAGTTYLLEVRWLDSDVSGTMPVIVTREFEAYIAGTESSYAEYPVSADSALSLSVEVKGADSADISYQWYKNGSLMEGEKTSSLEIASVTESCTYMCQVSNSSGVEKPVIFYVYVNGFAAYAAGTEDTEMSVKAALNTSLTLKVDVYAEDLSGITYEWSVYDPSEYIYNPVGENKNSLTIASVTERAEYQCHVSDQYGNDEFINFYVSVENGLVAYASGTETTEADIPAEPNKPLTLSVDVEAIDTTDLSYQWYREMLPIEGETGNSLVIDSVTDFTEYEIIVSDRYGNSETVYFRVYVDNGFAAYVSGTKTTEKTIQAEPYKPLTLSVDVEANDTTQLSCQWYQYGIPIEGETGTSLVIDSVTEGTQYEFGVLDRYGNSETVYFRVYVDNGFSAQLLNDADDFGNVSVPYGDPVTLTVGATANAGEITYVWEVSFLQPDGSWSTMETSQTGTNASYTIDSVTTAWNLWCYVSDAFGNNRYIWINVLVDNDLTIRQVTQTVDNNAVYVPYGETTTLQVEASARNGELNYQWSYYDDNGDWHKLADVGETAVTLPVIGMREYTCTVTDMYGGSVSVWFYVMVDNGLKASLSCDANQDVYDGDHHYLVPYGERTRLTVYASALDGGLEYSWECIRYDSNGNWAGSENLAETGNTLETEPITDRREYQCIVKDKYGGQISVWAVVSVDNALTVTGLNETNNNGQIPVSLGDPITLRVEASAGTGALTYQWYEYTADRSKRIEGETGTSFTVSAVTESKEYFCEVTDCFGANRSAWFNVIVDNALTAYVAGTTRDYTNLYVTVNQTKTLSVDAKAAKGTVSYQWYVIREPRTDWQWEEISGANDKSILTEPVTKYTEYVCEVTDMYGGVANVWFYLYIDAPADYTVKPVGGTSFTVQPGEDLTLAVEVLGSGTYTYEWHEIVGIEGDWRNLDNRTTELTLNGIRKSGQYTCRVFDRYGNEKSVDFDITVDNSFRVTAPEEAGPWEEVSVESAPGNNVLLSVSAEASAGPIKYTWYRTERNGWDFVEVQTGDSNQYIVVSATGAEDYYCRVTDKYGTAINVVFEFTVDNGLRAYATGTNTPYQRLTLSAGKTAELSVTASANTGKLTYRWFKTEYDSSGNPKEREQISGTGSKITTPAVKMHTQFQCTVTDIYNNTVWVYFDISIDNKLTAYAAGTKNTWANIYVAEGSSATLSVTASAASGELSYRWYIEQYDENGIYIDDMLISGANGSSYTTPAISGQRDEALMYYCQVTDKYGNNAGVWFDVMNADYVLSSESYSTYVGKTKTLSLRPVDGTEPIAGVTWSVEPIWSVNSKEPAVTVDENGKVTARNVGAATVRASYQEFSAMITVEVLFNDVADWNQYYYEPVYWAAYRGITTGKTASTFEPAQTCTRGQIVTFLWRMMGEPEPAKTVNPFKDVKKTDYYYKAVLWAYYSGITTGKTATTFLPGAACTRAQCVTFLWRAQGQPAPAKTANPFNDIKKTDYYYEAVLWAYYSGVTTGKTPTTFLPGAACTRGQIVTFLYRSNSGA